MIPIHLERREPARNRQRFYAITVTRTLRQR
jgi:predicted DNA-binding WGR domain protein